MEREVVIRFTTGRPDQVAQTGANEDDPGPEEVRGTVAAAGEHPSRPLPFTGWLQLLGHLEVLSGTRPAEPGE